MRYERFVDDFGGDRVAEDDPEGWWRSRAKSNLCRKLDDGILVIFRHSQGRHEGMYGMLMKKWYSEVAEFLSGRFDDERSALDAAADVVWDMQHR